MVITPWTRVVQINFIFLSAVPTKESFLFFIRVLFSLISYKMWRRDHSFEEFMHSHGHKTTVFVKMNSYIILKCGRLTKPHLKGALIRKEGLIGRRALNQIVTVITVLEAILAVNNRMKIYSVLCIFFPSCRLKFPRKNCRQMSGKSKVSDRTNLGTGVAPINC